MKSEGLIDKSAIAGFIKNTDLNKKLATLIATLVAKAELKAEQDKTIMLKAFDSSYFRGKNHFEDDGTQNYLVFQPMYRYFKKIGNTNRISSWKSKGLSDESIKTLSARNNILNPSLSYIGTKTRVKFNRSCLKQDKIKFTHEKAVNIYIAYEINKIFSICRYPTLENCLFGAVSLTKHTHIDQYKYSGYGIELDRKGTSSIGNVFGRNCIISGVDVNSSIHVDNKKKDILIFVEGLT